MERLVVRTPPAVVLGKAAVVVGTGVVVGGLVWLEMWFFDVDGAAAWSLGAGAATALLVAALFVLMAVPRLELDATALRVDRLVGGRRQYLLADHDFRVFGVAEGALFHTVLVVCDQSGKDRRIPLHFGTRNNQAVLLPMERAGLVD